jgi:hypothetical protein
MNRMIDNEKHSRMQLYTTMVDHCNNVENRPVDLHKQHIPTCMVFSAIHVMTEEEKEAVHTFLRKDLPVCVALNTRHRTVPRSVQLQIRLRNRLVSTPGHVGSYRFEYNLILGQVYKGASTDWYRTCKGVAQRVCQRTPDNLVLFRLECIVQQLENMVSPVDTTDDERYCIQRLQEDIRNVADGLVILMRGTAESVLYQCRARCHQFHGFIDTLTNRQAVTMLALLHATYASGCQLGEHE